MGFFQILSASFFFFVNEKESRITPAINILQHTNLAGSNPFCSKRNWAQVPETPHSAADEMAMIKPGIFWFLLDEDIGTLIICGEDISKTEISWSGIKEF